jgi:hypothetical protein
MIGSCALEVHALVEVEVAGIHAGLASPKSWFA